MKQHFFIIGMLFAIILAVLPVNAQDGPATDNGPLPPGNRPVTGKIVAVDPAQRMVRLVLFMRVPRSDAPGRVPAEMAQQAASLSEQATLLEQQGRRNGAERFRRQIEELLCWREIDQVMTNVDAGAIIGIRRATFDELSKGMHLRCVAGVNGRVPPGAIPERMTLAKDALQAPGHPLPVIRRVNGELNLPRTFFELVGDVTDTNPLILQIGDRSVQVDLPPEYGFLQVVPQEVRDLHPGTRVLARLVFNPATRTHLVKRLAVMLYRAETPFAADDLLGD